MKTKALTFLLILALAAPALAQTTSVQNGDINDPATWSGGVLPIGGDTGTWTITHIVNRDTDNSPSGTNADITDQTFLGQTLIIGDGLGDGIEDFGDNGELSLESNDGTLTVNDVVLNYNGKIEMDRNLGTLVGDTITFVGNGGHISSDRNSNSNRKMVLNFENFTGDGTVYFYGNNANGERNVEFDTSNATPGDAWSNFTGTLHVDVVNGDGGAIVWNHDIDVATFDIILSDIDADLQPRIIGGENNAGARGTPMDPLESVNGKLTLADDIDIKVTGLRLIDEFDDGTTNIDVSLADGVYTLDTLANPGAIDLANVGGVDYSRFFFGGTGTVEVVSGSGGGPTNPDGDYNNDGTVDLADYTLWRNNLGEANGTLPNDPNGTAIGTDQYNTWRSNFGAVASVAATTAAVPEPSSMALLAGVAAVAFVRLRRR